jgi:hypothetical protein
VTPPTDYPALLLLLSPNAVASNWTFWRQPDQIEGPLTLDLKEVQVHAPSNQKVWHCHLAVLAGAKFCQKLLGIHLHERRHPLRGLEHWVVVEQEVMALTSPRGWMLVLTNSRAAGVEVE